jgi:aryl-alcohol dehydrogenase-like predicted oxidoreductase
MKLIFGTAQLDRNYGINKENNFMTNKNLSKILKILKQNKINFIDTAPTYKNAEIKLGKNKLNKFNIVTKIPSLKKVKKNNIKNFITKGINESLKNLKIKKFYAIILHDCNDLINNPHKELIFRELNQLKNNGKALKIGFSCYDTSDIRIILKNYKIDMIQCPCNVFDQKILENKMLLLFKKKKIEVHLRSIFLQGLLLTDIKKINFIRPNWRKYFLKWDIFLKKNKIEKLEACINFVTNIKGNFKILIGFNNIKELKEIIFSVEKRRKKLNYKNLRTNDLSLIRPYNW